MQGVVVLLGEQGSGREGEGGALTRDVWKPRSLPLGTGTWLQRQPCVCVLYSMIIPAVLLKQGCGWRGMWKQGVMMVAVVVPRGGR